MQMKYHPKEIYYVVKDGFASIVLDYGEHKTIHQIFAAQQSVQADALEVCVKCGCGRHNHPDHFCNANYQRRQRKPLSGSRSTAQGAKMGTTIKVLDLMDAIQKTQVTHEDMWRVLREILEEQEAAQQSVQPTLLALCPECGVEQIVTHLPTCAHYVAQSG